MEGALTKHLFSLHKTRFKASLIPETTPKTQWIKASLRRNWSKKVEVNERKSLEN